MPGSSSPVQSAVQNKSPVSHFYSNHLQPPEGEGQVDHDAVLDGVVVEDPVLGVILVVELQASIDM